MKTIATLLLMLATTALADETISVYQLTGAVQCLESTGISPDKAADLLRGQGVKVISAERRRLPQDVTESCGAPVAEANVMQVSAADWANFITENPDAGGYGHWVFDESRVEVFKYDGTLQCGMGQEISLEEMAKELKEAGIAVSESRKGKDGLAHIRVCGASTGTINVYVIDRDSLAEAEGAGYRVLVTRELTEEIEFKSAKPRKAGLVARSLPLIPKKAAGPGPIPLLW